MAEDYLGRAIKIDRSDSDPFIYLALVELQRKKLPEAAESARQAIAQNPQVRAYHFIFGLIREAQGDREAAMAAFKAEVTEHPDNAAAAAERQKVEFRQVVSPEARPVPPDTRGTCPADIYLRDCPVPRLKEPCKAGRLPPKSQIFQRVLSCQVSGKSD